MQIMPALVDNERAVYLTLINTRSHDQRKWTTHIHPITDQNQGQSQSSLGSAENGPDDDQIFEQVPIRISIRVANHTNKSDLIAD